MKRPTLAPLLLCLASACSVGDITGESGGGGGGGGGGDGDGDGSGPDAAPLVQSYTLTPTPADTTITLNTAAEYQLTVASENFAGPVTLSVTGLPSSWVATFSPSATVDVPDNGSAVVTVSIAVPANGDAMTAPLSFAIAGALGPVTAAATMTVDGELIIPIASGTGAGNHGFQDVTIRAGTLVRFLNSDSVGHQIHTGDAIDHQDSLMGPGQSYDVTVQAGSAGFYCHEHGDGTGTATITITP